MKTIGSVVVAALLYATVRYNGFKGVAWGEWPTYVVNKAAALSALLLIAIFLVRRRSRDDAPESLLRAARGLIALHAVLSLALLGPASFPKYFIEGKPTASVAWSLLLAALAATGALAMSRRGDARVTGGRLAGLGVLAFVAGLHAALLGYDGWLAPSTWPGYMVPITVIAFIAGTVGLLAGARAARSG